VDFDKRYYEGASAPQSYNLKMFRRAETTFGDVVPVLEKRLSRSAESLIEIGAGSCAMGALVGAWLGVSRLVFADLSVRHIERAAADAQRLAGFKPASVEFRDLDMNEPFDLPDRSVDVILFHASLHHARNIWNCLSESFRVLKSGGHLLAVREQMCAPFRAGSMLRRLLNTREVRQGVSENAYLVEQYLYYLRANRFIAEAIPVVHGPRHRAAKRLLWFANGWLFSSFVLIGRKTSD
jgi:SAM-dependent methyltransferase